MWTSAQIRQQFIDYFKERRHAFVPSSPVVPYDDPTLLFTNAGMNQFKDVFLGAGRRDYSRAVNSQKCIRAGGKHNDLDDVGHDTYHHTFFEMLGNWSFGDYFKKESIEWAWELLTQCWGLDRRRLHATVFAGEPSEGLEPDHEAAELWRSVTDIAPEHVHYFGKKDNFWEMGDTGPCGPCSEIHVDTTPDCSGGQLVNRNDPKVREIWNLVFIQFNRAASGALSVLPAKHVDTGMGLERVAAVLQGKNSNYDTDLFTGLFAAIRDVTGAPAYGGRLEQDGGRDPVVMVDVAYRVLADHLRCLTFALADGAQLSNEGRGYVLRRILRRAVRYGRQFLGVDGPFLHRLVDPLVEVMGPAFPELRRDPRRVVALLAEEEESFGRTYQRGTKLFEQAAAHANTHGRGQIPGDAAFKLHDTYGFSIDLTMIMAQEMGLHVDLGEYERLMDEARERARRGHDGEDVRGMLQELAARCALQPTRFLGYECTSTDDCGTVDLFVPGADGFERTPSAANGQRVLVVLGSTPFYAEAGGQVGDQGRIICGSSVVRVDDTQKAGGVCFHIGEVVSGPFPASPAQAVVDAQRRRCIMANHTATHLMNWGLREVLGTHVDQKGSLVDDQRTRFDFSHTQATTTAELAAIEAAVQGHIRKNLPVHAAEVPQQRARGINTLRAVFGEKYPDVVRVVSIGPAVDELLAKPQDPRWLAFSVEFCGGTHLASTAEIEDFCIIDEGAVAKGIRRVTAVTGGAAKQCASGANTLRGRLEALHSASDEDLTAALPGLSRQLNEDLLPVRERMELRDQLKELQQRVKAHEKEAARSDRRQVRDAAGVLLQDAATVGGTRVVVGHVPEASPQQIREAIDFLRSQAGSAAIVLGSPAGDKVLLFASMTDDLVARGLKAGEIIREIAPLVGGGGGGKPELAQAGGKNPAGLPEALKAARELLLQALST